MTYIRVFALAILLAACAIRVGGPRPEHYQALGVSSGQSAPQEIADRILEAQANVVLLTGPADTAWFAGVAEATRLELSGPGLAGDLGLAFLAGAPVGDTTVVLSLAGGGETVVHDALYEVDRYRNLNLLVFRLESPADVRPAVRAVLGYVATDVMHNAAVLLGVNVPDTVAGDSVAALLKPAFRDVLECLPGETQNTEDQRLGMRLFYGPELRLRCDEASIVEGQTPSVFARLVMPN